MDKDLERVIRGLQEVRFGKRDTYSKIRLDDAIKYLTFNVNKSGAWVRHGEPPMYVIECSNCGQKYFNHAMQPLANYCSMCGTKNTSLIVENQVESK